MKKFDILYKRTKTGAIQTWSIQVVPIMMGNSYAEIQKTTGQLGTNNPIMHTEDVSKGKQKRSVLEQALFQAESDWKKKHDEGYKSKADLGIVISGDLMHYSVNHVNYKTLTEALNTGLPQFNSDANGNVKCMLATDWQKIKKVEYPCYCEPKLDGVRCLMVVNYNTGADGDTIKFLSRSGKQYDSLSHIAKSVGTYCFVKGKSDKPIQFILDGEIYSEELNFQEIVSAVKAYKDNSLKLKFRAYDIVSDDEQSKRKTTLYHLVQAINSAHISTIDYELVNDPESVKELHDKFVQEGYEGAILRYTNGKYAQGQRSRELLKVKEFDETEFCMTAFTQGQREEDLIAVCVCRNAIEKGHATGIFYAKMQGSRELKAQLLESHDGADKILTVKHFGWTEDGMPRFPIGKIIRDFE